MIRDELPENMNEFERMIFASVYAIAYLEQRDVKVAITQAANAVYALRVEG